MGRPPRPRDCRQVFIELDGAWHELLWNGLPPGQEAPAFSDAHVGDVLRQAAKAGLKPRSDAELLPVLLGLVASKTPVDAWPTQMTRQQKTERARNLARAQAAVLDRPAPAPPPGPSPADARALHRQATAAVEADRRRRRMAAVPVPPPAPQLLAEGLSSCWWCS
ncbi:hypothetical protein ABIE67_009414 [Streptomyces sp. V4I8]|uniref:hypothetical protein n=1 Tax=Streptomyces sp. V4I8 TaxID=3156469 RepID=UPI003511A075